MCARRWCWWPRCTHLVRNGKCCQIKRKKISENGVRKEIICLHFFCLLLRLLGSGWVGLVQHYLWRARARKRNRNSKSNMRLHKLFFFLPPSPLPLSLSLSLSASLSKHISQLITMRSAFRYNLFLLFYAFSCPIQCLHRRVPCTLSRSVPCSTQRYEYKQMMMKKKRKAEKEPEKKNEMKLGESHICVVKRAHRNGKHVKTVNCKYPAAKTGQH